MRSAFPPAWPDDLEVRVADRRDDSELLAMEASGFAMFQRPERFAPHRADSGARSSVGWLLKIAAVSGGRLAGYALLQVRNWDELYIYEMAARPGVVPDLGALLLGVCAELASRLGKRSVTANVACSDRVRPLPGYDSERLIAHIEAHGLRRVAQRGRRFDGGPTDPSDAWLASSPQEITKALAHKRWRGGGRNV